MNRVCHNSCIDFLVSDVADAHHLASRRLLFFLIKYGAKAKVRVLLWMFSSQCAGFIMQGEAKRTKQLYGSGAFAARTIVTNDGRDR